MSAVSEFQALVNTNGSPVVYHRDDSTVICPCRTRDGFRDPIWHAQNPSEPVCNAAGMLPGAGTVEINIKGFVHPVQSGAVRRLTSEQIVAMFGEIEADDHIGIFPYEWAGQTLNFYDWGEATEDWLRYNARKFQVVNANLIPDPETGSPFHHWEVGLRLIKGQ